MKTSAVGIALIKKFEGCRLAAYQDVSGVWTIGWGDTLDVQKGMVISQAEADDRFVSRLNLDFEPGVLAALGNAPVTQAQFDAMVSLSYNIGPAAFKRSTVAREHRAGNYQTAADAFRLWSQSGGRYVPALAKRREEERALYLSDNSVPAAPPAPDEPATDPISPEQEQAAVMAIQLGLRLSGDYDGAIDGIAGAGTKSGLAAFQQRISK